MRQYIIDRPINVFHIWNTVQVGPLGKLYVFTVEMICKQTH